VDITDDGPNRQAALHIYTNVSIARKIAMKTLLSRNQLESSLEAQPADENSLNGGPPAQA
jgi:hypothetical protein